MPLLMAGCKGGWGKPVQARVRAGVVVVDPPCLDDPAGCCEASEQMLVQAFIPEPPVEAFHEPVLLRLARRDVVPQHPRLLLPAQDRVRRQLSAVVAV